MNALGKSPSAKLSVRAPATARRWACVLPHCLSFLLGGDDPENRLVEEIPAEGFGGRRHAVHVFALRVASDSVETGGLFPRHYPVRSRARRATRYSARLHTIPESAVFTEERRESERSTCLQATGLQEDKHVRSSPARVS
jgi:hypothetical protein